MKEQPHWMQNNCVGDGVLRFMTFVNSNGSRRHRIDSPINECALA